MRYVSFLLLFLGTLLAPAVVGADELGELESSNLRLRAEYELAAKQQLYFVFDLPAKKVQFKASGISVAELPVQALTIWGQVGNKDKLRTVAAKHSYFTPKRDMVKIEQPEQSAEPEAKPKTEDEPKAEPKKFELEALELSDMPSSFQVRFDDGLLLSVKPAQEGFFPQVWGAIAKGFWYLSRPLISVWNFLHKKTYTEILLTMPSKDAQLIYWSLADGSSCLLIK